MGSDKAVRILLVEDGEADAGLVTLNLRRGGVEAEIRRADSRSAYVEALARRDFDIVVSDFQPRGFDGWEALSLARETAPDVPFIFVSDVPGEELAVGCLKEGAADYVMKPRLARLPAAVERALAESQATAERRRAEQRLQLLVGELGHRVKNTLATVSSIARLTLKRSRGLEEFERAFLGRLNALAEAHALVFRANWGETDLRRIIERTVAPFARDEGDFRLDGPPLQLPPKPALSLSLIIHELATNAVKYGALSSEKGFVAVSWRLDPRDDQVKLRWKEAGGPTVRKPDSRGFGAQLIERSTRYELDGRAAMDFAPDGLDCRLDFPSDWATQAEGEDLPVSD
jgi:two-component sensor histidine kinase/CheY-like chemotaxis protein